MSATPQKTNPSPARNEFIQVLRFAAAALVLLTHITFYYHARVQSEINIWHFGEIGVNIFFVISGVVMVVASQSLPLNAGGAQQFIRKRLLRIVPLYWLITFLKIVAAVAIPTAVNNQFDWAFALKSLFLIPTYNLEGLIQPIHGVGWTLLHEMFFYLVFASMLLLRLRPVLWTSLLILTLFGLGYWFKLHEALPHGATPHNAMLMVATRGVNLCFVIGMVIGTVMVRAPIKSGLTLVSTVTLLTAAAIAFSLSPQIIPMDSVLLVLGAMMLLLATWSIPRPLQWAVALGESSYALYLLHPIMAPPLLLLIHKVAAPLGALAQMGLVACITIVIAHGLHKWVERPLNRWAQRFF